MSRKQNPNNARISSAAFTAGGAVLLPEESGRVRELIATRHSKAAVELAKDLCKRSGSAESKSLLVEAYQARIEDLLRLGMAVEAKSLLAIVCERFPEAAPRLAELRREICARDGRLEEVVGPLRDANLPAEDRVRIETFIRQRFHDLPALASALPAEHPLREAASALAAAFQAVTRGPVDDAVLALPLVSRRSPLASWKALVRAIASYYRREDEDCMKWLRTISDDALVARLLPPLTAMMGVAMPGMKSGSSFSPAEQKLIASAGDHDAALRHAVAALDQAFAGKKRRAILGAVRDVAAASGPDNSGPNNSRDAAMRERLRQHIAVRVLMREDSLSAGGASGSAAMVAASGGLPRKDAYYYRLLARGLEQQHYVESGAEAVLVWEKFRREAIQEKWFAAGSLEDGVLSLHMAKLVERLPADLVEELNRPASGQRGPDQRRPDQRHRQPVKRGMERDSLPAAGSLYARASEADPHPDAFHPWLNWARKQSPWQVADDVAERWRQARPEDVQPLLFLMESAEKRGAFKKSLTYLNQAEELDQLNPEVRRAKVRLLLAAAIRHLRQRKSHLALGEVEQLQTLPEVRQGEITALVTALRRCCAAVDGNFSGMRGQQAVLEQSLGMVPAFLLMSALEKAGNVYPAVDAKALKASRIPGAELLAGTVRASILGDWAGLPVPLPHDWHGALIAALKQPNCALDAAQMMVVGEAALRSHARELAYAVSVAGLAGAGLAGAGLAGAGLAGGEAHARFLFLRARALPPWESARRDGCFAAALELARRERNMELAGKILDELNQLDQRPRWSYGFNDQDNDDTYDAKIGSRPVSPELLSQIVEEEQEQKRFPSSYGQAAPRYASKLLSPPCDCPVCRGEVDEEDDEEEWDVEDEDAIDESDMLPIEKDRQRRFNRVMNTLPREVREQLKAAVVGGEDPIAAMARILASASAEERVRKPARPPHPDQSSLF